MELPANIGPYTVTELIGAGGMAEVFKGVLQGVDGFERPVAVKRILPHLTADTEFAEMFQAEAELAVQLSHGNIVQIFKLGRHEGTFYMAMEFVDGRDLRAILDQLRSRGEQMPISHACAIIADVCEGLDYAHRKQGKHGEPLNLIHRDITPRNVLVSFEGQTKVIDFGLAKAATSSNKTRAGTIKGKLAYLSPEQLRGEKLDARSDLFAVGIVLFELLTNTRLFGRDTDIDTFKAVRECKIPSPKSMRAAVPTELETVLFRALAQNREDRFDSAGTMRQHLQAVMFNNRLRCNERVLGDWMEWLFDR